MVQTDEGRDRDARGVTAGSENLNSWLGCYVRRCRRCGPQAPYLPIVPPSRTHTADPKAHSERHGESPLTRRWGHTLERSRREYGAVTVRYVGDRPAEEVAMRRDYRTPVTYHSRGALYQSPSRRPDGE
jgi:hypothetical protein